MTGAKQAGEAGDMLLSVAVKRAGKIKGEASAAGHEGEIVVRSWGWGVHASSAIGSGAATGRRSHRNLTVVKSIDTASTGLMNALVSNDEVTEAKLTMRKAGEEAIAYFSLTLSQARVVDVDLDVDEQGEPVEKIGFSFQKIAIEYHPQAGTGARGAAFTFEDEWSAMV